MHAHATDPESAGWYGLLKEHHDFRLFWLGQVLSLFGDRLHQVALLVLIGSITGTNLNQIGLLFATIGLPSLLFGLAAGALVDRWDRRRTMIGADLLRVPLVLSIPVLARIDVNLVYPIVFALTTVGLFFRSAKEAFMLDIVPRRSLHNANALANSTESVMDVIGYPLVGVLIAGFVGVLATGRGADIAFAVDAASYLLSAFFFKRMRLPRAANAQAAGESSGLLPMIGEGLAFVGRNARIRRNTLLWSWIVLLTFGSWTLIYGTAALVSSSPGVAYALCEGAIGLGAVVGGVIVARLGSRVSHERCVVAGMVIMGLSSVGIALFPVTWWLVAMMALSGVGNMLALIPSITLIQEATPAGMLGRVVAFRRTLFQTGFIVANLGAGWAAAQFGIMPVWGLTGAGLLAIGLGACLLPRASTGSSRHTSLASV